VNVAEEAVAELLPYKELFTSVVPGQDHKTAATSSFLCLFQLVILAMAIPVQTRLILKQSA